jgi:hypothetical protein
MIQPLQLMLQELVNTCVSFYNRVMHNSTARFEAQHVTY